MIKFLTKLKTFVTKDANMEKEPKQPFIYTEDQLMVRLKFFIGICLALTLTGIVFVVLYSIIFVTQPLNAISPIDQKFFELIIPIATFLTGTLSGIMLAGSSKEDKEAMLDAQKLSLKNFEETKQAMLKPVSVAGVSGGLAAAPVAQEANTRKTFTADEVPEFEPAVVTGYGGKQAPVQPPQPEI